MKIIRLIQGNFAVNTYIVRAGEKAVVIDPAGEAAEIYNTVGEDVEIVAVLLTHGHFDHTGAAAELKAMTGAKIYIHENDAPMLDSLEKSVGAMFPDMFNPCQADVFVKDGEMIEIGEMQFKVMQTPGHSIGSVMYFLQDVIFSGDTVFKESVGRTDHWSGDGAAQKESMKKIRQIKGNYRILPGHGEETTLDYEKQRNPFLNSI
jgi:glyoxylase-like metal-dependent hydrolase (beta-lactamase superfamily II)